MAGVIVPHESDSDEPTAMIERSLFASTKHSEYLHDKSDDDDSDVALTKFEDVTKEAEQEYEQAAVGCSMRALLEEVAKAGDSVPASASSTQCQAASSSHAPPPPRRRKFSAIAACDDTPHHDAKKSKHGRSPKSANVDMPMPAPKQVPNPSQPAKQTPVKPAPTEEDGEPGKRGRPSTDLTSYADSCVAELAFADEGSLYFGDKSMNKLRVVNRYVGIVNGKLLKASGKEADSLHVIKKKLQITESAIKIARTHVQSRKADDVLNQWKSLLLYMQSEPVVEVRMSTYFHHMLLTCKCNHAPAILEADMSMGLSR
eukprot:5485140-Lingulodinium_polyedra.AAC.1